MTDDPDGAPLGLRIGIQIEDDQEMTQPRDISAAKEQLQEKTFYIIDTGEPLEP